MHHETPDNRIHDLHPTDIPGWYMGDELQDDARIGLAIRVWHSLVTHATDSNLDLAIHAEKGFGFRVR